MIKAKILDNELGQVGEITSVDPAPIVNALNDGYIPVIATVGTDDKGTTYNINADTAAAEIAAALGADNSLIPQVFLDEIDGLIKENIISGGMIPKMKSIEKAMKSGVRKAVMIDGRIPHAILIEIFSDEGIGTLFSNRS